MVAWLLCRKGLIALLLLWALVNDIRERVRSYTWKVSSLMEGKSHFFWITHCRRHISGWGWDGSISSYFTAETIGYILAYDLYLCDCFILVSRCTLPTVRVLQHDG